MAFEPGPVPAEARSTSVEARLTSPTISLGRLARSPSPSPRPASPPSSPSSPARMSLPPLSPGSAGPTVDSPELSPRLPSPALPSSSPVLAPPAPVPVAPQRPHTRSRSGIVQPKQRHDGTVTYLAACLAHSVADPNDEPRNYEAAMSIPHWRAAMEQEYHALMHNETWTPVPPPPRVNIIDSKWVFKVKRHADGSIER